MPMRWYFWSYLSDMVVLFGGHRSRLYWYVIEKMYAADPTL